MYLLFDHFYAYQPALDAVQDQQLIIDPVKRKSNLILKSMKENIFYHRAHRGTQRFSPWFSVSSVVYY
jgi:hypothetical protein